jgi:hypothetical protein
MLVAGQCPATLLSQLYMGFVRTAENLATGRKCGHCSDCFHHGRNLGYTPKDWFPFEWTGPNKYDRSSLREA